jgi:2-oxoisovalerate dehydrogenase E1 component alpha subunit
MVENNRYAISESNEKQMATKTVAEKACGLGLPGTQIDGNNLDQVYLTFTKAIERARMGEGPSVIETLVYRITPHSSDDDDRSYRSREEVEQHKRSDALVLARNTLEREGVLTPKAVDEMDARAKEMVDDAVKYSEAAPYPDIEEGTYPVYVEDIRTETTREHEVSHD